MPKEHETIFATATIDPVRGVVTTNVRTIKQSDIGKCPHHIFMPDHYRDDGSCKCNDPEATEMKRWGYKWMKKLARWM